MGTKSIKGTSVAVNSIISQHEISCHVKKPTQGNCLNQGLVQQTEPNKVDYSDQAFDKQVKETSLMFSGYVMFGLFQSLFGIKPVKSLEALLKESEGSSEKFMKQLIEASWPELENQRFFSSSS